MTCDFYANSCLFSGFSSEDPFCFKKNMYLLLFVLDLIAYIVILHFFIYNSNLNHVINT